MGKQQEKCLAVVEAEVADFPVEAEAASLVEVASLEAEDVAGGGGAF